MADIVLIFKTRHRSGYSVERDVNLIADFVKEFSVDMKIHYNGRARIAFRVNGIGRMERERLLLCLIGRIRCEGDWKSLDLIYYSLR